MPDANLADNAVLTSSFYNTYIREQVVVTCTSGTRPSAVEGRLIYETDTDLMKVYNGSSWVNVGQASSLPPAILRGTTSGSTNGSGDITISYGDTFTGSPTFVATPAITSTTQISCHLIASPGVSSTSVRITSNNAVLASTAVTVHWIAVGTLA